MKIELCDLSRQTASLRDELDRAIRRVIDSGSFILGQEVRSFEEEVSAFLEIEHSIGVASGTDAIWLALRAGGVGPGDQVVTSAFTFFATASAIFAIGATPVLVDIDPDSFNMDPAAVAEVLERTNAKALVPVHLYGQPCDMDELMHLAREKDLVVVEDACQAIGASYDGQPVGGFGLAGAYSFFPSKNLGAFGDGGLVATRDAGIAEKVSLLRGHGSPQKYHHEIVGTNSRLDSLQAAVLRVKLAHLEEWTASVQRAAARYNELLKGVDGITTPIVKAGREHVFHQYTIRVAGGRDARDALQKRLTVEGIGTAVYYPIPVHLQRAASSLGYSVGDFPHSERASAEVLSLPIFPEITDEELETVAASVSAHVST